MSEVKTFEEISAWVSEHFPDTWVDLDLGQLDGNDSPAPEIVLIGFPNTQWTTLQDGRQQGDATIRVRIAMEFLEDSYVGSKTREKAIEKMQRVNDYHKRLQGLFSECFSPLERFQSGIETLDNGRRVFVLSYRCIITDTSASGVDAGPSLTLNPVPEHNQGLIDN